ncbi:hypothetical protein T10_1910 [Trichinella papuae]|uniref:PiggyBac transposable element-derived protein domain-containing protein n=1 Tax=Trichinella papuae TaxID=268474 RepID=A0A0V1MCL7_9BILA|nr:hypothetical protein T10_1910 [Trichinella papuae]
MSETKFKNLLRFCLFDDSGSRAARLKSDRLAAFRDFWAMFQTNLKNLYKPSAFLTVDEQLVATSGRSKLRQYMPCNLENMATYFVTYFVTTYTVRKVIESMGGETSAKRSAAGKNEKSALKGASFVGKKVTKK